MRTQIFPFLAAVAFVGAVAAPMTAMSEPPLEQLRLSVAAGTIAAIEPKSILLRPDSNVMPSKFSYDTGTKFVDSAGQPVLVDIIRAGDPATIHYSQNGQEFVAERVIVKPMDADIPTTATTVTEAKSTKEETPAVTNVTQTEKKKQIVSQYGVASTKSTETAAKTTAKAQAHPVISGTVSSIDPNMVVVQTESTDAPLHYAFTKTTEFINEDGQPVSIKTVKTGAPLTIQYVKQGKQLLAQRVVVRKTEITR